MTQEELERDQRMLAAALESSLRDAQQQERQPEATVQPGAPMKAVPCGQGAAPAELWGPEAVDFVPADMQHMTAE